MPNHKTVGIAILAVLALGFVTIDAMAARKDKKSVKEFNVGELCDRQYASGLEFKKNSRLVDAKDAFVSVIEACPDYRKAFVQLGNIALQLQSFDEAIGHYEKALSLDANDPEAKEALGFAYQRAGRMDDAVDLFLGILDEDPNRLSSIQYLAVAYEQQEKKPEAFMLYQKAFVTDPTIAGLEEKLTNLSLDLKQYEQAYAFTRRQVDRDSTNIELKRKLAYFHYKMESWDRAVEHYQKLVDEHPEDPGRLGDMQLLGYCLNKAGRMKDAFPVYDYILEHDDTPEENSYYFYATTLIDAGLHDKAINICNQGLQVNGTWGCLAYLKGEALSKKGDAEQNAKNWEAARSLFKQAKVAFAEVHPQSRCAESSGKQQERQDQLLDRLGKIQAKEEQSGN